MKEIPDIIQQVAPTLGLALKGPFAAVAQRYIQDHLPPGSEGSEASPQERLLALLDDAKNLHRIKDLDQPFRLEMQKLGVDLHKQQGAGPDNPRAKAAINPQVLISVLFLIAYFSMLAAIFYVEISDEMNMQTGDNSLMDQLQILFGVLTAGVVQVLSYWFGGTRGKPAP
ncbi:hypothetical protein A8C75_20575 [Marinobacterium aestuarii]|uniref:Uncharacterized protein n=1 Tax=Marinobacterium aestuarii TaxID=1821621 RepID=A0A1A9F4J6_9GAMM|nr:hypothetical protein [Marinobacterium aestuarii]ANG64633.1 hypothetical protein A8C75_20575 [Marinobacterium aestuarii]